MPKEIQRYKTQAQLQALCDREVEKFKTHFPYWTKQRGASLQYTLARVELDSAQDYTLDARP